MYDETDDLNACFNYNIIINFDYVGFQVIEAPLYKFLMDEVKPKVSIGLLGGSDLTKVIEQMGGDHGMTQMLILYIQLTCKQIYLMFNFFNFFKTFPALKDFDFVFSENGVVAFKNGEEIGREVRPETNM